MCAKGATMSANDATMCEIRGYDRQGRDYDRQRLEHERQGRNLMRQGFAETAVEWENGGPGEMYGFPTTVTRRLPGGVPEVCIFAEGVRYRASQS